MRFARLVLVAILAVAAIASPAPAQTIGVFADQAGTDCDLTVNIGPVTFYVVARLGGPVADGIQGAEFRIIGLPPGWFLNWFCGAACVGGPGIPEGNDPRVGVTVSWPTCQTGVGGVVLVGTISGFAPSTVSNHIVRISGPTVPTFPGFACPNLILCDAPVFPPRICVPGGELIINGPPCTVGVQPAGWSQVKAMFD